jgi:catechol 2,3-dioxygenase-like lactoylglutathione lyase family enzyme
MPELALHHVSIITMDLERSLSFYREVFGLEEIERPPFSTPGVWLACGGMQIHLIAYADGTFRRNPGIDRNDWHFAFRTDDFEGIIKRLEGQGFREDADEDDPRRMLVDRHGLAGFPQVYLRDPDRNTVEINGAP